MSNYSSLSKFILRFITFVTCLFLSFDWALAAENAKQDLWVVQAYTKSRLCPVKQKQLIAHVTDGKVSHLEGLSGSAAGNLQPSGDVAINAGAFGVKGYVKGKAIGDAAAGEWTSNSAICSKGTWLAIRAAN